MEGALTLVGKALNGPAMVNVILFCVAAVFGQILHGVWKWTQGDTASVLDWFLSNKKSTVAAVIVNITATITAINLLPIETMSAYACLYAGALCGLGGDTVNKGARPEWTPEQRAATAAATGAGAKP